MGDSNEIKSLQELSRYVMEVLRDPITKKLEQEENASTRVTLANLGDLMFCYGAVLPSVVSDETTKEMKAITTKRQFIYDLEKCAYDKMAVKDKFTTINSTRYLWGLAKFQNRNVNPLFNQDPANTLIHRSQVSKVPSVAHRVPKQFATEIMRRKKQQTAENMCLSLFAMASLDYYDYEYFENVLMTFIDSNLTPQVEQLSFLTQAAAILRRSEYT